MVAIRLRHTASHWPILPGTARYCPTPGYTGRHWVTLKCSESCPFLWGNYGPSPDRHVYGPLRAYARFGTRCWHLAGEVVPGVRLPPRLERRTGAGEGLERLECRNVQKAVLFCAGIPAPSPDRHVYGPLRAYARFGTRSSQVPPGSHWGHRPVPEAVIPHIECEVWGFTEVSPAGYVDRLSPAGSPGRIAGFPG